LQRCEQEANSNKFKLSDILSVPMQRVLKYHLLLDKLVEETPREWIEDFRALAKAREVMVDVAQYINEVKRDSDTLDIIKDIQASIIDWDVPEDAQLKDFGRLLRDGELKVCLIYYQTKICTFSLLVSKKTLQFKVNSIWNRG